MSGSVVVLTPNGRRQTVKVTPNTTILQILEEVCKKQGFQPEEFELKHHKKILDVTITYRFSGLPNNAQLELVAAQNTRLEAEVVLGVHLEDGRRLMGNFKPSVSVWDVLVSLCPVESQLDKNPVVIYMRQEVYGPNLQSTTLKSLGLTGGRAMLRLIHRNPEDLKTQANVSVPIPSKPVEEKPYIRQFQPLARDEPTTSYSPSNVKSEKPENKEEDLPKPPKEEETPPSPESQEPAAKVKPKYAPAKPVDMLSLIKKEKDNLKTNTTTNKSSKPVEKKEYKLNPTPKYSKQPQTVDSDETLTSKSTADEFIFLGERNAMVFSLENSQAIPSEDLPDDFFDLTISDAKKILKDLKRRRFDMENGQLLTSNLRNLEESKKQLRALNRYKKSIIRVQFPDRIVLQGTFAPTDTVDTVLEFVKEYLADKNIEFYVYMTPPKTVLSKESRLIEIGCVPGAILHFGVSSTHTANKFLREDVLDKLTSSSMASLAAAKMREQSTNKNATLMDDEEYMEVDNDVNVGASTSAAAAAPPVYEDYDDKPAPSKTPGQVPKWFKPSNI